MFDQDFFENEIEIKKRIAVVFDETPFHGSLTARDLNVIFGGIYPEWNKDTFYSYLQYFEIREDQKIAAYSKGLKMKLQLACALSHNAELLILDEPTAGLDPVVREEVLQILLKYMEDGEHSILMSTHITSELDKIADMVTLIDHGSILFFREGRHFVGTARPDQMCAGRPEPPGSGRYHQRSDEPIRSRGHGEGS